jgi:hypothetical protein
MNKDRSMTAAAREYAAAYAAHYTQRDLRTALGVYKELVASHTGSREAGYSRTQIRNIVNAVVPGQELLDAETALALARIESRAPAGAGVSLARSPSKAGE